MRRIIIKEARPGMVAARTLATAASPAVTLLSAGDVLSVSQLACLHGMGTYDLWVNDPGLDFLDDLCSGQPTSAHQRLAVGLREAMLRFVTCANRELFKTHAFGIEEIVGSVVRGAASVPCFQAMTDDEALLAHSCDVAALAILLGMQLENYLVEQRKRLDTKNARGIHNLALGALFHDVGELMLPAEQRESRIGPIFHEHAGQAWRQHTDEGYAMVRGKIDPSAAVVVQHHHQNFDGTGFAGRETPERFGRAQEGATIHVFARIAMAADMFAQITMGAGRVPQPMVKTLWELQQAPVRKAMDPVVHDCLMSLFPAFSEGMIVTLTDGRKAIVTTCNPMLPCYPVVQTLPQGEMVDAEHREMPTEVMDLSEEMDIGIQAVDGTNIDPYLYGVRKGRPLVAA